MAKSIITPTNINIDEKQNLINPTIRNSGKKVTSVNGKVGDVYLNAHDVGTYSNKEIDEKISQIDPGVFSVKSINVNGENYQPNKKGIIDLPDYPTEPTALSDLEDDETHRLVSDVEKQTWDSKSDFSGDYNDLTNKPNVPTKLVELESDSTHRTVADTDISNWNNKSDFSGDYDDLQNKPTIPTQLSQLNGDNTHRTVTDAQINSWNNKSNFDGSYNSLTNKPTIPTALSDLSEDEEHNVVSNTEKDTWNNKSDFSGNYNDLQNKPNIPTALSQLSQDATHRVVTDIEKSSWNSKSEFSGNYDDLTNKPDIPSSLSDLSSDTTHRTVTDTEKSAWNNKSNFSGSYNDLTDKPTIPTSLSDLTADSTHRTVTDSEKSSWNNKSDFSGNYNDLTNKPTIPVALSDLTDDTKHRTVSDIEKTTWNSKSDFDGNYNNLTNKPNIPSKTSDLTNDSGFATNSDIPTSLSELSGDATHRTVTDEQILSWNNKANVIANPSSTTSVLNSVTIDGVNYSIQGSGGGGTGDVSSVNHVLPDEYGNVQLTATDVGALPDTTDIPSKTSDLDNDSNFVISNELSSVAFSGIYNDLTNKPTIPAQLSQLSEDTTHRVVTDTEKSTWNSKSDFSGSYNDLTNKPVIPTNLSDLNDDSTHRTITDSQAAIWDAKSNFSGNYNDLTNKPSIPSKTSELTNNSGFITNAVNNLVNYYLKSEVYTKAEVEQLIATISTLHFEVVEELPTHDIQLNAIYLVPNSSSKLHDYYDEYIYVNGEWEIIGSTQIDLSNYVTIQQLNQALASYVTTTNLSTLIADYYTKSEVDGLLANKVTTVSGKGLSTNDYTTNEKNKLAGIQQGAEVNVQADWEESDNTKDSFIINKPTIPTALSDLTDDSTHRLVSDTEKTSWDNKSDFSGSYNDLTNKPILGTASNKDVPTTGDASNTQVVLGNDSRLSDSRPASDVSSWAKASAKPTYTASEVGAVATSSVGVANGVAQLGADGKVKSSQLPSLLELGETSSTAYRGDRGALAYNHSQVTSGNPHNVTATDIGLGNVANTGDSATPVKNGTTKFTTGGAFTELAKKVDKNGTDRLMTADEGTKLAGIETNAQVNVKPNWNATSGSAAEILNKPTIPTKTSDLTNDSGFITSADVPTALSDLTDDSTHRLVTDSEKSAWSSKADVFSGTTATVTPTQVYNAMNVGKTIEISHVVENATWVFTSFTYYSGTTIVISNIIAYAQQQFFLIELVGDVTGNTWNTYATSVAQLTDIPTALADLTADATHRLVTDTEKSTWNGKSTVVANPSTTAQTLTSITIDGVSYAVSGGGSVNYATAEDIAEINAILN